MPARMKVYYLHNIDGRRCGMIAARSKAQVREVVRVLPAEMTEAGHAPDAQAMALAEPGVLFVAAITELEKVWRRDGRRATPST